MTTSPIQKMVPAPRGSLPTWTWGNGPTVLLVHGWNGAAVHWNEMVVPLMSAGFSVVAFDAPGHGLAPRRKTNVIEWRSAVQAIAQEVGPIHGIVGHSFGSLASILAIQAGVDVKRVVLISGPANLASLTVAIGQRLGFSEDVSKVFLNRLGHRLNMTWQDVQSDRVIASLDVPVLVVHDEDDREVPWVDGATMVAAAKEGELLTTRGLGHRRIVRDAGVIQALVRFLSDGSNVLSGPTEIRAERAANNPPP